MIVRTPNFINSLKKRKRARKIEILQRTHANFNFFRPEEACWVKIKSPNCFCFVFSKGEFKACSVVACDFQHRRMILNKVKPERPNQPVC